MSPRVYDVFGYCGNIFLGIQLIPQIIKTIRTRSAEDISYMFLTTSTLGLISAGVYAIHLRDLPIILGLCCGITMNIVLAASKFIIHIMAPHPQTPHASDTTFAHNKKETSEITELQEIIIV
jgi:uncharacterized protein with PQ loop repeat